ncbi:MAG TPA: FtsQ-type POTRA domain-containing protein [Candidatus Dojkabacteria bacterium]|nr:FtsQ-type POTRA domain-containing protein [Candidatus Dojkabacteria bacterium]
MPVKIKDSKSWFKERVSRFKPVIFLKKNLPFFIFLFLFALSLILGLWNMKRYEVFDINGDEVEEKIEILVNEYLSKNVTGKNFFSIYSNNVEDALESNISYVKSARVSKIVPNKLEVFLEVYEPKLVVLDVGNHCKLLSATGIVLDELCQETEDVPLCCVGHTSDGKYYIFKSDEVEISKITGGKEQLLVMNSISDIVKVVESFGFEVKEIVLKEKVLHIKDMDKRVHIFTLSDNLDVQLARYFLVMGKVKGDSMQFSSIDVRFERPVVKD